MTLIPYQLKTVRPNLYDYLKVFAIVFMIVDHVGFFLFPEISWFRLLGRLAFPVFLFLVGFNGSYRWRWSLWIMAIILQILYFLFFWFGHVEAHILNILFGIAIVRLFLQLLDWLLDRHLRGRNIVFFFLWLLLWILVYPYLYSVFDYGSMIFVFGMLGYYFRFKRMVHVLHVLFYLFLGIFVFGIHLITQYLSFASFFSDLERFLLIMLYFFVLESFVLLSEKNFSLKVQSHWDYFVCWFSTNALWIYVVHMLVLSLFWLVFRV